MNFNKILEKYRKISFSERDKGDRFERLMQAYLLTDPYYSHKLKKVWLWNDFHAKKDLGGADTGIDLVALTFDGDYWAIQCKCYQPNTTIDKPAVDAFLSTSSREFKNEALQTVSFSHRLWIDTTGKKWGANAEEAIKNQNPTVSRRSLYQLQEAPVNWGNLENGIHGEASRTPKKTLRPHQLEALDKTHEHFKTAERGKLIMACGTGKTFNSLRIAEHETNGKGLILFLVPSIALLGQTLREWSAEANEPINAICICSDPEVSRKKTKHEDSDNVSVIDLAMPASTNTKDILRQFHLIKNKDNSGLTVVFSTYQSIEVIARAQKELLNNGFGEFDLIICDEAHRTTGVSLAGEDESAFTKVHDNSFIQAKKRLYMTATPRLYSDDTKSKAAQAEAILCSMERQVERISRLITEDKTHQQAFAHFLAGLQKNINPSISQQEAVEMLSQHIITKPVFEALFEGYSFVKNNPISVSMQKMLDVLEDQAFDKDAETLQKFYESVKMRASGIDNAEGKQRIIIELYDKFFKTAFPKMVEKLGIVYTPVEVVDFIIHSVNDVLKKEFDRSISDENIHILDPFTGTGTFVTRLLQSGLIAKKDLKRKYQHEIHANEIVLLAYYIAAVNIENAYHDAMGASDYQAFEGICLTDTFQLGESDEREKLFSEMFPQNSERVENQKKAPLRIIMGNPPYSVGQKSANDNAQNQKYEKLDGRIAQTYALKTDAVNKNSLYDSYLKAFRWSTDRLAKNGGIICFVSNGAWLDGNSTDGFRKCLEEEFTSIYVFNLRGNQRTSGELSRKEGGKIFGSGSRTPISITLLVKKGEKT